MKVVSLKDLHNLLSIQGPVLEWADSNRVFSLTEILIKQEVLVLIFYLQINFTRLEVINVEIDFTDIFSFSFISSIKYF
jgi:hypothetical protein